MNCKKYKVGAAFDDANLCVLKSGLNTGSAIHHLKDPIIRVVTNNIETPIYWELREMIESDDENFDDIS